MSLQINLLGRFSLVLENADATTLIAPRMRELLAWLILHSAAPSPRRIVASVLWPDVRDDQALKNLRTLLTRLRSTLPQLAFSLHASGDNLQWRGDPRQSIDVHLFQKARGLGFAMLGEGRQEAALAHFAEAYVHYAGELLPGHYTDWINEERERFYKCWFEVANQYARLLLVRGDLLLAQEIAGQLQRSDPLHEGAAAIFMHTQLALQDRVGALRTYHSIAGLLRDEIGVEPGSDLQTLYEAALFEDNALQGSREAIKLIYALWHVWKTPTPRD